jgi:hypothetical protein
VTSYSRRILAAMNGEVLPPPQMASDQLGQASGRRGQVQGSMPLVDNGAGQAPPDLVADSQTGQLFTTDGQPYLGRALFLQADNTVVDSQGRAVNLPALERAAGYNPDLVGQSAPANATAPAGSQTRGAGQPPPDIFTNNQGQIVTADGRPYLNRELYMQADQKVVDRQGNEVNLAELERAAGFAPPPAPAPPQYFRGANDQIVDIDGQPYLGVTMFLSGNQALDINGQQVDWDATIAAAGYDPDQDPVADQTEPSAPSLAVYGPDPTQTGIPQPETAQGESKPVGIVRNLLAVAGDYHRWRQSVQPPGGADATTASTKPQRKTRTANVPKLPTDKPRTRKTGQTQAQEPTQPRTRATKSTNVNPDLPVPGTRDMRITKAARTEFLGRKREILQTYKGEARLPREAQQLTEAQRTRMRTDVREHQVATKQFKEAYTKVQRWNKRDPGTLTTTEHRSMVRDQQTLELSQKQVQKSEAKLNDWYRKVGKKPVDTVVTVKSTKPAKPNAPVTPAAGPRQVTVSSATRKAFQTEWKMFTTENAQAMTMKKSLGSQLTATQQTRLRTDMQNHQLSQNHLTWKQSELQALQKIKPSKLTAVQQRQLTKNQQLVNLAEQNVQKTGAKVQAWETKLGHKLSVQNRNGKTEIGLGTKLSETKTGTRPATRPTTRTSTKGNVKPGARTQATHEPHSTGLKPITGRILPGLLALNDAYSLYQGVSHWNDTGNNEHYDDALRVGGSALSTYASVQAFRKGNLATGVGLHATGIAMNLLGQMTNDQD